MSRHHPNASAHVIVPAVRHGRDPNSDGAVLQQALGQLWQAGVTIDWAAFHADERVRRVPLPTYPFEKQRYWIDDSKAGDSVHRLPINEWIHMPSWRQGASLSARAVQQRGDRSCLLLADDPLFVEHLRRALENHGVRVYVVAQHRGYVFGANDAKIDPLDPEHYRQLLLDLDQAHKRPDQVIHAFNVGPAMDARDGGCMDAALVEKNCLGPLYLAQAMGECWAGQLTQLHMVGQHMVDVAGGETLRSEAALMTGVSHALAREGAGIDARCIDVGDVTPASCAALALEVLDAPVRSVVAIRGARRWVQEFTSVDMPPPALVPALLRHRGVYVITGGLGGIGLVLARYLATTVQARLVLLGRQGLPPRATWNDHLSQGIDATLCERISAVTALEDMGSDVLVMPVDVADDAQVATAIAHVMDRHGVIHGLVHAAGVAGNTLIGVKTAADVAAVIRPKVAGVASLHQHTCSLDLDFFAMCSSLSAIAGGIGMYDYVAANAFLDGFASQHDGRTRTRYMSIGWDAWRDVGMAAASRLPDYLAAQRESYLQSAITNEEGAHVFARILDAPQCHYVVSTRRVASQLVLTSRGDAGATWSAVSAGTVHPRPELAGAYAAPGSALEQRLVEVWQEVLAIDGVGIDDNFFDLGGDSLLITRLHTLVRHRLPEETRGLTLRFLFEQSTVAEVATHLTELQDAAERAARVSALRATSAITEEGEI
jgi:acyl transferase domain-containing protein